MQTAEIIRSAVLCMENNSTDDPRCLAAAQELYNVVAGLGAKEIRSLTTTPEQEERRRFQQQQMELEQQQQSQFRSSSSVANTNNNNSRTGSAVKFADQVAVDNKNHPSKTSLTSTKARSTTRSSSAAHSTRSPSATSTTTSTSHSTTTTTMTKDTDSLIQSLPPHLMGFVSEAPPPLHVRSLIHLAFKCYSGAAGFIHPSPTVEHVAQVTLVTLRLCVAADAIHETKDVQLLSELALQLGAGRTNSVPTPTPSSLASTLNTRTNNHNSRSASSTTSGVSPVSASSSSQIPQISTVSVLAAIELFMVALYNNRISSIVTDCALSAAFRHWLSAWLVRIEDGSASQPIEIFHRLCCFQRLVTLRPTAAANVFAAQGFHERLIDFVCGDGAAVHASSIGLALHLLAQMVEDGPENLMMRFVTPKLIELHIASWSASEWTETLEGAFVLLTACVRLGLSLDLWKCIVHANLHLVCSHAIASPSVRVAAAAATCLRTMLFMCQRDLDIGLSVFFDTLASPNIFRVLDNHGGAKLMMSANNHHSNNKNEQQQQQDVTGLRILTTECALIVAVFASFSPQHRVAAHHVSHKLHFPLSMQRALLTMNDADLSLFVNWTLFDEAGRSVSGVDDKQFNLLLKNRPLAPPPPGTTLQEWTDAAYVKFSLQKALQPPSQSDIASVFGFLTNNPDFPTNPKPPGLGSKDLSLALLKWFSTPLQVVAATEGKTSAQSVAALVPTKHHQQASSSLIQLRADTNNNNNESTTSSFDEDQFTKDHFESCVNLIIRFAKCSPVDNGTEEDREGWNSPIDSNKKRRKQQHPMSSSSSSSMMIKMGNSNNNNNTKLHVDPMSLQRNRANAAGINSSSFMMMNQSSVSSGTTSRMMNQSQHKKSVNTSMRHGASVSMASSTMNTSGVRRTHLFSHPYVDYYLNAQKKNAYTPIPAIPPQVRRWDLEDIQKRDLFSFLIRLDGLEHLIAMSGKFANKVEKDTDGESHQQDVSAMTSTNAASSPSSSRRRRRRTTTTTATPQSALEKLHRETPNDSDEDDGDYDDDDFDEEYEEEVEEEVEEEIEESDDDDEQDAKKPRYETHIRKIRRTIRTKSVASDDDDHDEPEDNTKEAANSRRKHVSQELFSQERNNKNTVDQSSSPSSLKRRRILHSSSSTRKRGQEQQGVVDNYQNQNQAQEEEQEREAHAQLQHRVTTLIADALHRAELHLLKMNEKTQCCPVKMLNRRAFLVDMVNNVMPAIISMLTMLFSVAKRAPAAVVRVARRVERSEAAAREGSYNYASMAGRRSPSQNLENQEQHHHSPAYHGSITINPANICAVCFQLEMEMAWY